MGMLLELLGLRSPTVTTTKVATVAGPTVAQGTPPQAITPPVAVGAITKEQHDYDTDRAAVQVLITELNGHAQTARIATEIAQIVAKMGVAATHAGKAEWVDAMRVLGEARTACVAAKTLAEGWADYAKKRASMKEQATAYIGLADDHVALALADIATADAQALGPPPDFVTAKATLDLVNARFGAAYQSRVDKVKARLATVEAMSDKVKAFLATELVNARALVAKAEAALAAKDWSQLIMSQQAAGDVLAPAERFGERRDKYETQRTITAGDIAAVKGDASIKDRGPGLDAMLASADALASHDTLKIEEGLKGLLATSKRCDLFKGLSATVASHDSERKLADTELAALATHAAAAQVATQREAIKTILFGAANAAQQARASAGDPTALWNTALTAVQRARVDLAEVRKLADSQGPAAAAKTAAAGPADATALTNALKALKADADSAGQAAFASEAAAEFKKCKEQVDKAEKALAKNDAKGAAKPLGDAATALAAARAIQAEHAQYAGTLATVEAKLKTLQALGTAVSIKGKIDAVVKAIAEAKAKDKAHAGPEAMAALRRATDAAAAAEQADKERIAYNAEAKKINDRVTAEVTDVKVKKTHAKAVEEASKLADAFRFADATKALLRIDVLLDNAKLKAGAASTPPDPGLAALAAKMVGNGGAAEVDAMIQAQPDTIDPKVMTELATGRYGVAIKIEGSAPGVEEVKSMRRICEIFAKIPQDIRDNPSIKGISHVDAVGKAGGGYTPGTAMIGMEGRRGHQQKFGSKQVAYDKKTNKNVSQLPGKIDPACKPKNEDEVEYLGFAAAHEVAHGLDDARGFMAKYGGQEKYGGWTEYGGGVQPIADAVGAHVAAQFGSSSFYKNAETRKYVLDTLMTRRPDRPAAPAGSADFKALDAFDLWYSLATAPNVYRRQPDCDAITIGTLIYHEAYARNWVSYLAAARAKGLTGYQFRAPGEWFAELYAGWKTGKLGSKHPALEWLTKLSSP